MGVRFLDEETTPKPKIRFLDETTAPEQMPENQSSMTENIAAGFGTGAVIDPIYSIGGLVPKGLSYVTSLGGLAPNPVSEAYKRSAEDITLGQEQFNKQFEDVYGDSTAASLSRVGGNIAASIIPANAATSAVAKAAPMLSKAPVAGKTMANLARNVGAYKGIAGIPVAGAIQGGTSTLVTEGDLSGVPAGAIGAGLMGAAGKIAKPITDDAVSAIRSQYAKLLQDEGIGNLSAGQVTGSRPLEIAESTLANMPFTASAAAKKAEGQLEDFTSAALRKAGVAANRATPEVRGQAEQMFNKRYGDLINNEIVNIDKPVLDKLAQISSKQLDKLPLNVKPVVQSYIRDIAESGGQMSGEAYQVARSQLSQQAKSMANTDTFTAGILRDLRDALDDAAERSLPEIKKGDWQKLRRQYANYKAIQKAASSNTNTALEGLVTPSSLLRAVETANKTKGQAGYGELYDLSRAGKSLLYDGYPDSFTPTRQLYQNLLTGGAAGGMTYGYTQDPKAAALAAGGVIAAPKMAQYLLNSDALKRYATQGLPYSSSLNSNQAKTAAALLAAQGVQ